MIPDKNFISKNQNDKKDKNDKNNIKTNAMKKAEEAVKQLRSAANGNDAGDSIKSDMLGSYTGMFYDGGEPDQDADDL